MARAGRTEPGAAPGFPRRAPPGFALTAFSAEGARVELLAAAGFPARHGFTCRHADPRAGMDDLGRRDAAGEDLARLAGTFGVSRLCALRQVHGRRVERFGGGSAPRGEPAPEADAFVIATGGAAGAIKTADCVPVLLADPASGAVAGAHAGWRGTCLGVAGEAVRALHRATGTPPEIFHAVIGPAIGPCCFEVGPEVLEAFAAAGRDPARFTAPEPSLRGRPRLDLPLANRLQLLEAGLDPSRIALAPLCTRCLPVFHSYRREGPGVGRNWSVIATGPEVVENGPCASPSC